MIDYIFFSIITKALIDIRTGSIDRIFLNR